MIRGSARMTQQRYDEHLMNQSRKCSRHVPQHFNVNDPVLVYVGDRVKEREVVPHQLHRTVRSPWRDQRELLYADRPA